MDIQNIINGIAEQLQGTNALIQIQVEGQYYIRIIGDSSRLSGSSRAAAVPDTRPFLSWMKEQIEQAPVCENTKISHRNAHMRLTAFRPDDILTSYFINNTGVYNQGGVVYAGKLFIGRGYASVGAIEITVVDLMTKCQIALLDLYANSFRKEPEGLFVYDNKV